MDQLSSVVIGGGPAGLTAAYELVTAGLAPCVFEKGERVGGISRTEEYRGYRFDIGGHRFFTKVPEVEALWHEVMGDDFLIVKRLSRIYYGGKFYRYPLDAFQALKNLGLVESALSIASYLKAKFRTPYPTEENLEHWVVNKFGERLFRIFFKTYTEKVWGVPCTSIRADWAAQRIRGMSLKRAIIHAVRKSGGSSTLIEQFHYPPLGPGMMWERFAERVTEKGGEVRLQSEVTRINHDGRRVTSVDVRGPDGAATITAHHYVNSMPITHLIRRLNPEPPDEVRLAAENLKYRDFIVVALIVDDKDLFPDQWIYVHSPKVRVGRIQNFKNWSARMVPDAGKTCVGMEYFTSKGDDIWEMSDEKLISLATRELHEIGLADAGSVEDGTVIRQPMAYPIYDETYRMNVDVIRQYLAQFENLQTVGRAGMHRYNNQDHSMLTAMLAVQNILGAEHDLWDVNVERSYHEEFSIPRQDASFPTLKEEGSRPPMVIETGPEPDEHR